MKTLTIALSTGLVLASVNAYAGSDFEKYDTDGNGVISQQEAQADSALVEQFKALDTNTDGELSKEEFAGFKAK